MQDAAHRHDDASGRKARGAFFTPPEICSYIAEWAVRSRHDRVMEPSCGDAAFLLAAGARLASLGAPPTEGGHLVRVEQLQGVELHEASAVSAATAAARAGVMSTIHVGDFFDLDPTPTFDAVIGNPPYVRYQDFTGEMRAKAQRRALAAGRPISGLASSWAPFVLHAGQFLAPGGRLGLVLPAELLSVNYAATIRSYLLDAFSDVELILFDERVFPGVLEEVVLLLAERNDRGASHFQVRQLAQLEDLERTDVKPALWSPSRPSAKWLPALLPPDAAKVYSELMLSGRTTTLDTWGSTYLGAVTGNNRYFALTAEEVVDRGLGEKDVIRISPPGSRHLRGLSFAHPAWTELLQDGARALLLYPQGDEPSPAAADYIAQGENDGVDEAYKCRVRSPWWKVPIVDTPHLFLTYMNHDTPRLVRNAARVRHLNSIHGVKLHRGVRKVGEELLPLAALNSMTVLGAELVGRSYGGGMLKIEPKEADQLPVPSVDLVMAAGDRLRALAPQLGAALRGGALQDAIELVDRVLLVETAGLRRVDVRALRAAREAFFDRRAARG